MAVSGVFSDYIVKNYKRLLVCVAPPVDSDVDGEEVDHDPVSNSPSPKPVVEVVPPSVSTPPSPNHVPPDAARSISPSASRPHSMPAAASRVVDVSAAASQVPSCNPELDPDMSPHEMEAESSSRWRRRRSSIRTRLPRPRRLRPSSRTQPSIDSHFIHGMFLHPTFSPDIPHKTLCDDIHPSRSRVLTLVITELLCSFNNK